MTMTRLRPQPRRTVSRILRLAALALLTYGALIAILVYGLDVLCNR